jgi:hypothetical protein
MSLNRKTWFGFGLFLIAILNGCEYQPDKTYFRDLNQDVPLPDLTIDLNLSNDTVYVYSYSNVKLSLKLTNKTLLRVKYYVDNAEVESYIRNDGNETYYYIDLGLQPLTKVRAEIYTSTGTGSIADQMQAESFVCKTREWVLIYNPDNPVINSEIVDGRLKISWTPVRKNVSTAKYYIYHGGQSADSTINNWIIDSTFIGGHQDVYVSYKDNTVSVYGLYGEVNYPYPEAFLNNTDSFYIYWTKPRFYNNIKGYRISVDGTTTINGLSDTSYTYKDGKIGSFLQVQIDILLRNFDRDENAYFYLKNLSGFYPQSFLQTYAFYSASFFPFRGTAFYYYSLVNNWVTLFKFSLDSKSVINSKTLDFENLSVSPNDKYVLCNVPDDIELLNTADLSVIKSIPVSRITGFSYLSDFTVSDAGRCAMYDIYGQNIIIYDVLNDTLVGKIPITHSSVFKISADGKYLFNRDLNTLFGIDNQSLSIVWSDEGKSNQYSYFEFFPENTGQIALYDGEIFYIKSCTDFSTVTSFSLDNKTVVNIDFANNKILTLSNSVFYLYSLTNGNLLNSVPASFTNGARLFNNYIFVNNCQQNLNNLK